MNKSRARELASAMQHISPLGAAVLATLTYMAKHLKTSGCDYHMAYFLLDKIKEEALKEVFEEPKRDLH